MTFNGCFREFKYSGTTSKSGTAKNRVGTFKKFLLFNNSGIF